MQSGDLTDSPCQPGHCIWRSLVHTVDTGREKVNTYGSRHLNVRVYTGDKAGEDTHHVSYLSFHVSLLFLSQPAWSKAKQKRATLFFPRCDNKLHTEVTVWVVEMFVWCLLICLNITELGTLEAVLISVKAQMLALSLPPHRWGFKIVIWTERLRCGKMLRATAWGGGGGIEVMDAEKLSGWQEREEAIWAFWDCVRVHLQIGWQQQRGHVVRVDLASCSRARGGHPHCPWSHLPSTSPDCLARSL